MGHGEDPSAREQTECTSDRHTGEGEDVFLLCISEVSELQKCSDVYIKVYYLPLLCILGEQQRL